MPAFIPQYLINGTICGENITDYKMYFDFLYKLCFLKNLILETILRYTAWLKKMDSISYVYVCEIESIFFNHAVLSSAYIGFRVKYPSFFSDFNPTCILWANFRKILKC
jgi:hypothetical protein